MATDTRITTGTNTCEIRSASFCTGAFFACASLTNFAICASVVSAPTLVARTTSRPEEFMVAPVTTLSFVTSTGTDSPVSMDSSTAEWPSTTTPSVAIFSPGLTTNISPTASLLIGIRCVAPSTSTETSFAPMSNNARNASELRPFARVSNHRPNSRNTITMPTDSK